MYSQLISNISQAGVNYICLKLVRRAEKISSYSFEGDCTLRITCVLPCACLIANNIKKDVETLQHVCMDEANLY